MKYQRMTALLALALVTVACGGGTEEENGDSAGAPDIVSFTAEPATVAPGEPATLTWEVTGSDLLLSLTEPGARPVDVTDQPSYEVELDESVTYTLSAENNAGRDAAEVTITVEGSAP